MAAERAKALEKESAELEKEAEQANAGCGMRSGRGGARAHWAAFGRSRRGLRAKRIEASQ
jgi:hypothetical protein